MTTHGSPRAGGKRSRVVMGNACVGLMRVLRTAALLAGVAALSACSWFEAEEEILEGTRIPVRAADGAEGDVNAIARAVPPPSALDAWTQVNGNAAHNAGHGQPLDRADGHEEQDDVAAEEDHQDDDEDGEGQRVHDVHDAHHDGIGAAAEEAGRCPVEHADAERNRRRREAHHERDAAPVENAREQIAAEVVCAEPVLPARGRGAQFEFLCVVSVGRDQGRDDGHDRHARKKDGAEQREPVLPQAAHGVLPERGALLGLREIDRGGVGFRHRGASGRASGARGRRSG